VPRRASVSVSDLVVGTGLLVVVVLLVGAVDVVFVEGVVSTELADLAEVGFVR
jgi:hypothetical protein